MQIHREEIGLVPLHRQARLRKVDVAQRPDHFMLLRLIVVH
jgi:hypothetical protein